MLKKIKDNFHHAPLIISLLSLVTTGYIGYRTLEIRNQTLEVNKLNIKPQIYLYANAINISIVNNETSIITIEGYIQNRGNSFCTIKNVIIRPYKYITIDTAYGKFTTLRDVECQHIGGTYNPTMPNEILKENSDHTFLFNVSVPYESLRKDYLNIDIYFEYEYTNVISKNIITELSAHYIIPGLYVSHGSSGTIDE